MRRGRHEGFVRTYVRRESMMRQTTRRHYEFIEVYGSVNSLQRQWKASDLLIYAALTFLSKCQMFQASAAVAVVVVVFRLTVVVVAVVVILEYPWGILELSIKRDIRTHLSLWFNQIQWASVIRLTQVLTGIPKKIYMYIHTYMHI